MSKLNDTVPWTWLDTKHHSLVCDRCGMVMSINGSPGTAILIYAVQRFRTKHADCQEEAQPSRGKQNGFRE